MRDNDVLEVAAVIGAAREALVVMGGISDRDLGKAERKLRAALKKLDKQ